VHVQQCRRVGGQEVRSLVRTGGEQGGRIRDAREDQEAGRTGARRALDVGVQPVPHDQRPPGTGAADALGVHGRVRLAGHQRRPAGDGADHPDHRPVARQRPSRGRDGGVGVRGHVPGAAPDGDHRFRQLRPPDIAPVSLDDGERSVLGGGDHRQTGCGQRRGHTRATHRQHPRADAQQFGHDRGGRLGAGDDIGGGSRDPQLGQVLGHVLRRPRGVVRHEAQPHAGRAGGGQGLRHAGDRVGPDVDDPVEVEQRHVVAGGGRLGAAPGEGRRGGDHEVSPVRRARTPRSARE
jgi:hypothetical protein